MLIGYMRVSTGEQSLDLQRDALAHIGTSALFGHRFTVGLG
jgi:DNA invertase Pin-like site-specific DNA recombinase